MQRPAAEQDSLTDNEWIPVYFQNIVGFREAALQHERKTGERDRSGTGGLFIGLFRFIEKHMPEGEGVEGRELDVG